MSYIVVNAPFHKGGVEFLKFTQKGGDSNFYHKKGGLVKREVFLNKGLGNIVEVFIKYGG